MGKVNTFRIEDEELIARELTVTQVEEILNAESERTGTEIIELMFPDRVPLSVLLASTGLTGEGLEKKNFPPSVLEKIFDEVEKVNPISAGLFQRLAQIGRALAAKSAGPSPG